ncbi:hypothetical protein [Streptomyces sp. NPDC101249]|uniref:hypothetical protein n=1 Tax=Streptomyces sp. NPDC101249 TaxID=3366140 RepID=UPI0037F1CE02
MTHIQPAFDGVEFAAPAPAVIRRVVDDYEAWVDEVWNAFIDAADTGQPFTVDEIARTKNLPDPPQPKTQWGRLPERLLNAGVIRHHDYGASRRARQSLVHVWIGVPAGQRQATARARREARAAARAERRAA